MRSRTKFRYILSAAVALMLIPVACAKPQPDQQLISSLEKLASTDNAEAIYHLGMAWHTGSGVPQDYRKAFEAFKRSAALGDPLAAYKLGCYYAGQGDGVVAPDEQQALNYKIVAAQAGYALAQQDVAAIYAQRGEVIEALKWIEKSADQGWGDALITVASIYNGFKGVAPDAAKTSAYFRLFLTRNGGTPEQQTWLAAFDGKLSDADRGRAEAIIAAYRPRSTALTIKALSGQRGAEALVASKR